MQEGLCLGIDWGEARIGLATGDLASKVASPEGVAKNLKDLLMIIKKENPSILIVGNPMSLRGGQANKSFKDFLDKLKKEVGDLPIILIDERMSSAQADSLDKQNKRKGMRDSLAAMVILQSYFDGL
ncbi:MAG: Holliday junction resolvase RuvX [Patescibacteria group bacterium]|nr:MAG: Holliday junction resolvase RuvX [Patescibacteria group bacterium]